MTAAEATTLVRNYTADLVAGDYAGAWAMLSPQRRSAYGSLASFKAERAAYFKDVKGRYSVMASPGDLAPINSWAAQVPGAVIDPSTAVLVKVAYPLIASRNAYDVFIVARTADGPVIYIAR